MATTTQDLLSRYTQSFAQNNDDNYLTDFTRGASSYWNALAPQRQYVAQQNRQQRQQEQRDAEVASAKQGVSESKVRKDTALAYQEQKRTEQRAFDQDRLSGIRQSNENSRAESSAARAQRSQQSNDRALAGMNNESALRITKETNLQGQRDNYSNERINRAQIEGENFRNLADNTTNLRIAAAQIESQNKQGLYQLYGTLSGNTRVATNIPYWGG